MTQTAPFVGRSNHHTDATVAGLRNMAELLAKSAAAFVWMPPSKIQLVVYGNFCDVVTWDEVGAWVGELVKEQTVGGA
jgi:hypothetical protein